MRRAPPSESRARSRTAAPSEASSPWSSSWRRACRLRQLRYFVVSAEELSFAAAARRLHISQPSISTALADLEVSFGVQLFIRHHASGLSLTQAGRDMLGRARDLLKIAEELQVAAKEMDAGVTGAIALGCLTSLAPPIMPKLIRLFTGERAGVLFH